MDAPNPAAFYSNAQTGEYRVAIDFTGRLYEEVSAASPEAARAIVEQRLRALQIDVCPEDLTSHDIASVRPLPTMYLVVREGKEMGVSHLQPGDEPRAPSHAYEAARYAKPEGVV